MTFELAPFKDYHAAYGRSPAFDDDSKIFGMISNGWPAVFLEHEEFSGNRKRSCSRPGTTKRPRALAEGAGSGADQRRLALSLSSAAEPGHSSCSPSALSGVSTVLRWPCRSCGFGLDIEQPGDDLALGGVLLQKVHRGQPVVQVVIGVELAQREDRAVMLLHQLDRAGRVIDRDRRRGR